MVPTLFPGDRVIVLRGLGPLRARTRVDDLVAVCDPRDPGRLMVKRVAGFDGDRVVVRGDNEAASTDSRHFGAVDRRAILGRVVYRYYPERRRGRLGAARGGRS
jgi:nickel-type superoxide dismutase maturation protease